MMRKVFLLIVLLTPLYVWRLQQPGFSDTEGMFAEPAREMVESGDWITPRMNGAPFLTKPPLMYWLSATTFAVVGPTEYARLWSVFAALATVFVTGLLGQELFGAVAGLAAAAVLATSVGFFVEARMLRADMVMMLTVTLSLYWYVRVRRGASAAVAMIFWSTLGIGVLDKGFVPLVIVGGTIALHELATGELRPRTLYTRLQALHTPWGVLLIAVIIAPWHLAAGARNPGFLWDYIVNQHLLFFFDKKLPRDSIPDSLGFFWTMFFVRGLPWSLLLPLAVVLGWPRDVTEQPESLQRLPFVWLVVVLGFFSLAVSRLTHYSLPALPALALLVAHFLTHAPMHHARGFLSGFATLLVLGALATLAVTLLSPTAVLIKLDPTLAGYGLESLVRPAVLTLGAGLLGLGLFLQQQRYQAVFRVGIITAISLVPFIQTAQERVEALFSWRPFARLIKETVPTGSRVFFRAEDEYQLCGGLNYYLQQRIDVLAPPDWTPPTFLSGRTDRLFTAREELAEQWRAGAGVLVADAVTTPREEAQFAPGPYRVSARAGERVLLRPNVSRASEPDEHDGPPQSQYTRKETDQNNGNQE